MEKWGYIFLTFILIVLFISLSTLNKIEKPLIERSLLPRCQNNEVVISPDLKYSIINYSNSRLIQGMGDSYFNNHFIFKNVEYSELDCVFVVSYEYVYDELHKDMSLSIAAMAEDHFEIIDTNSFLRPVGILISSENAEEMVDAKGIRYEYYNIELDVEGQTFIYNFYGKDALGVNGLLISIDAQSGEVKIPYQSKEIVPLI